jgi:hypothetical protein
MSGLIDSLFVLKCAGSFGGGHSVDDFIHAYVKMTEKGNKWPMNTPLLTTAKEFREQAESPRSRGVIGMTIFPACPGSKPEASPFSLDSLHESRLNPLPKILRVLPVDELEVEKCNKMNDYVHDIGAICFVIEKNEGRANTLKFMEHLFKKYRINLVYNHTVLHGDREGVLVQDKNARIATRASFIDIQYTTPLYDTKKVDGVGIIVENFNIHKAFDEGTDFVYDQTFCLLSNFDENIYCIDGKQLSSPNKITKEYIQSFNTVWKRGLIFPQPEKGKQESVKAPKKSRATSTKSTLYTASTSSTTDYLVYK